MITIKELQNRAKKREDIKNILIDKKIYYLSGDKLPAICLKNHQRKIGDRTAFVYGGEKWIGISYPVITDIEGNFIKTIRDYSYFLYLNNKDDKKEFSKLLEILKEKNIMAD